MKNLRSHQETDKKNYRKTEDIMSNDSGTFQILRLILEIGAGIIAIAGAVLAVKLKLFSQTEEKQELEDQKEVKSTKQEDQKLVNYRKIIKDKEKEIYPKLLSFYLYLESNINELPQQLTSFLENEYGLSKKEPTIDWGEYKWDPNMRKYLKERIDEEPEIKEKLTLTGSYFADYFNFLSKKAELEAQSIVEKLLREQEEKNEK